MLSTGVIIFSKLYKDEQCGTLLKCVFELMGFSCSVSGHYLHVVIII